MVHAPDDHTPHTHTHTHHLTYVKWKHRQIDLSGYLARIPTYHKSYNSYRYYNLSKVENGKKRHPGNKLTRIALRKSRIFGSILVLNYKGTRDSPKAQAEI